MHISAEKGCEYSDGEKNEQSVNAMFFNTFNSFSNIREKWISIFSMHGEFP